MQNIYYKYLQPPYWIQNNLVHHQNLHRNHISFSYLSKLAAQQKTWRHEMQKLSKFRTSLLIYYSNNHKTHFE